jgi:hypothetical protein
VGAGPSFAEGERETTSWERVRFGKWGENLESESEMSTHSRFQRLFLNFLFSFLFLKKKRKEKEKMCHVGQEPDTSRTLDARIALLECFFQQTCFFCPDGFNNLKKKR